MFDRCGAGPVVISKVDASVCSCVLSASRKLSVLLLFAPLAHSISTGAFNLDLIAYPGPSAAGGCCRGDAGQKIELAAGFFLSDCDRDACNHSAAEYRKTRERRQRRDAQKNRLGDLPASSLLSPLNRPTSEACARARRLGHDAVGVTCHRRAAVGTTADVDSSQLRARAPAEAVARGAPSVLPTIAGSLCEIGPLP